MTTLKRINEPRSLGAPIRAEVRFKNNRLVRARMELGMTQKDAAEAIGINASDLGRYEGLKVAPYSEKREWSQQAEVIAAFYGYSCEELWPEAVMEFKARAIALEIATPEAPMLPDAVIDDAELVAALNVAVASLPPREREVIVHRFGLGVPEKTLDETGECMGIRERGLPLSRTRVQQIEKFALRELRHPSRTKRLREAMSDD